MCRTWQFIVQALETVQLNNEFYILSINVPVFLKKVQKSTEKYRKAQKSIVVIFAKYQPFLILDDEAELSGTFKNVHAGATIAANPDASA